MNRNEGARRDGNYSRYREPPTSSSGLDYMIWPWWDDPEMCRVKVPKDYKATIQPKDESLAREMKKKQKKLK